MSPLKEILPGIVPKETEIARYLQSIMMFLENVMFKGTVSLINAKCVYF
jgi:hypothetical protein